MTTVDKSENYLVWDDTEAVTVTLRRASGDVAVSVSVALRGQLTSRDVELAGVGLGGNEVVWNIPDALLNPNDEGRELKLDDYITTADAEVFRVTTADAVEDRTCWRCITARDS